jgi:serine/threonine protein kinase
VGNYHLLGEPIGKGGFASVYVGKHAYLHHDEQVAIKVIEDVSQTDSKFEEFLREAKILSGLSHRNIVKVKDFGVHNDKFAFLVMEYAPHGTLHDRHPNGTPALDLGLVVKYADQIADALAYVHEQKFIHRDVKPRNILVASDGRLLLSDFGLVQIAPSTPTQKPGKAAGTYGYMAPEQLQGKPRPASDQYALGVMVYEWLSGGEHPFFDPQMTLLKQTDAVKDVIIRALHPDPKQRYEKVTDFAKALKQAFILSEAIEKTYSELDIVQFQLTNR